MLDTASIACYFILEQVEHQRGEQYGSGVQWDIKQVEATLGQHPE
jgi:hypothetical protein